MITKSGENQQDKTVHYYFNYSANLQQIQYPHRSGNELLSNKSVAQNTSLELEAWGTKIIEEN